MTDQLTYCPKCGVVYYRWTSLWCQFCEDYVRLEPLAIPFPQKKETSLASRSEESEPGTGEEGGPDPDLQCA